MGKCKTFCCVAVGAAMLMSAAQAAAQYGAAERKQDPWAKPKENVEDVQIRGKILAVQGDVLQVTSEAVKQQWLVKMPRDQASIRVVGTAWPSYLQPGMPVRFSGVFDVKGNCKSPIESLEVFTPVPVKSDMFPLAQQYGVFPEQAFTGQLLEDARAAQQPPAAQPKSETASFLVIGHLRGFRKGELYVAAGPTLVRAPLSEKAKISVEVPDLRWLRPGDEIELDGWSYSHMKTHVVATKVTIQAKEPLGPAPEEKPVRGAGEKPAKDAAKEPAQPAAKTDDQAPPS